MKTTTLLPERDYYVLDNQFYFLSKERLSVKDWFLYGLNVIKQLEEPIDYESEHFKIYGMGARIKIIASTSNLECIKQLDRKYFVKKEDVEDLAKKKYPYEDEGFTAIDRGTLKTFADIWKKGYNANKGEFTREEMQQAYIAGMCGDESLQDLLYRLRPLSLPKSIEVDSEYNVIKVNW